MSYIDNLFDDFVKLYVEKYGYNITREMAQEIVHSFAVTDDSNRTNGEKWTMEETKALGDKLSVDWSKVSSCDWYIVVNMMYSDHYKTAKKHGLTDTFFAELACDWFNDADAREHKTFTYFIHP